MIELPERHWRFLAVSLTLSTLTPWALLSPDVIELPDMSVPTITKLKVPEGGHASVLFSRPIFNKDRSPAGEIENETQSVTDFVPELLPLPTLVGVAVGRGKAIAILKSRDGTTQNLEMGSSVDGWQLVAIDRHGATLRTDGVTQNIELDYGNKILGEAGYSDPSANTEYSNNITRSSEGQHNE